MVLNNMVYYTKLKLQPNWTTNWPVGVKQKEELTIPGCGYTALYGCEIVSRKEQNDDDIVDHTRRYDTNRPPPSLHNKALTLIEFYSLQSGVQKSRMQLLHVYYQGLHWEHSKTILEK